jgi:hypothetical protein
MHWSAVGFRSSLARRSESALLEHASITDAAPTGALYILSLTRKDALTGRAG